MAPPPPPPPPPTKSALKSSNFSQNMTNIPNRPQTASFNGPFFKVEEVGPYSSLGYQQSEIDRSQRYQGDINQPAKFPQNEIDRSSRFVGNGQETVVVWPPQQDSESRHNRDSEFSSRPNSRSLRDPDRSSEFHRQKQLESLAIQQKREKEQQALAKQFQASQLQQQRLQNRGFQTIGGTIVREEPAGSRSNSRANLHNVELQSASPALGSDPGPSPMLRVYETRPISSASEDYRNQTWRRTYIVEDQEIAARNEIIKSEEVLQRDQYDVDLLNRRDTFVEKPESPIQIHRTGRVWQPPPEEPYVWPTASSRNSGAYGANSGTIPRNHTRISSQHPDEEFQWVPTVSDPGYKHENKNFTPTPSPPHSPIKGHGTRPLDEVAVKQIRKLVTPQPDGSHRPQSVFKSARSTPSGGFVPQAPNSIRAGDSPQPTNEQRVIQESRRKYRVVNGGNSGGEYPNDWEKIYELPPHASTLTEKVPPRRVDVSKRTELFERRERRSHSAHSSRHQSTPLTIITDSEGRRSGGTSTRRSQPTPKIRHSTRSESYRDPSPKPPSARSQRAVQIFNEATRPSPPPPSYERARRYVVPALPPGRKEKPKTSPPRPPPGNTRRLLSAVQTAASAHQHNRPLSASLQVSSEPKSHDDLEELSRKTRELAERSKSRKNEFKLVGSEIIKTEHESVPPPPQALKTPPKEQYSPASVGTTTSAALHQLDRGSDYIMDQSSATWQYNTQYNTSFSPRSVVSINGNRRSDDGLLKIRTSQSVMNISRAEVETKPWPHMPADLEPVPDSPQSTMARHYEERYSKTNHYNSMPALDTASAARGTMIQIQDEKQHQRTVMEPAEESESRSQLVRQTREVVSSGKPRVTETIQRVEERKVTEETERRVLRRERKHRSHRSAHRSHHSSAQQEAIGWQEGGAHRSSSASRGGSYYAAGSGYDYNPRYGPPVRDYPTYQRGYEPTYYHSSYHGYDLPPTYPRRTASATLYH
ncbi:unnamed protein product [Bursaphelenchus okinawaensis]|uniref:Uncharacterized protein n=1 Tax=Bursaphelenchus okinawaensis TaxID=465554 RepID=A0A811KPV0_9BILA|nr:unnamed protein product [Bursaphelenchus okinawaensis]CAG9108258.1 unnamed protein product [Bursaphelenchus okinawaensis]